MSFKKFCILWCFDIWGALQTHEKATRTTQVLEIAEWPAGSIPVIWEPSCPNLHSHLPTYVVLTHQANIFPALNYPTAGTRLQEMAPVARSLPEQSKPANPALSTPPNPSSPLAQASSSLLALPSDQNWHFPFGPVWRGPFLLGNVSNQNLFQMALAPPRCHFNKLRPGHWTVWKQVWRLLVDTWDKKKGSKCGCWLVGIRLKRSEDF